MRPARDERSAPDARVATLLHSCGMKYDANEVAHSAKLTRLMPGFIFAQAVRKRTMLDGGRKKLRVVGYKSKDGSTSADPREAALAQKRERLRRLGLKGHCCRATHHGKPWDLAEWLEARDVKCRVTWHRNDLEMFAASLDRATAAVRCEVEETVTARGVPDALPTVKVVRTTYEVRARVCHPHELSALTWRHRPETAATRAKRESAKHSDLLPDKFDSNKPKELQNKSRPPALRAGGRAAGSGRRTSIDDLVFVNIQNCFAPLRKRDALGNTP